jgi:hypothetical protein
MKRVFGGIVKTLVLAALLVLTALLAWAFESRNMLELQVWHSALDSEFTAQDATPQSTLQDYLDREAQLFDEPRDKIYRRQAVNWLYST